MVLSNMADRYTVYKQKISLETREAFATEFFHSTYEKTLSILQDRFNIVHAVRLRIITKFCNAS